MLCWAAEGNKPVLCPPLWFSPDAAERSFKELRRRNGKSRPLGQEDLSRAKQQPSSPPGIRQDPAKGWLVPRTCAEQWGIGAGASHPQAQPKWGPQGWPLVRAAGTMQSCPVLGAERLQGALVWREMHWTGPVTPPALWQLSLGPELVTPVCASRYLKPHQNKGQTPRDRLLEELRGGNPESGPPAVLGLCSLK